MCPPIPCANNSASYVRPYIPPHTQRIAWKPHTYKRAALLLLVLPIRIDSRHNTPQMHTLYCVLSCLLSCTHTTNAAPLARFTLGGSQPTRTPSADACNQRRQRFNHETPAAALGTLADDLETQGQPQPLQTIPPAWTIPARFPAMDCTDCQRPPASRAQFRQTRRSSCNAPPAWAVSVAAIRANWATFPRFSAGYLRTIQPQARRHSCALA